MPRELVRLKQNPNFVCRGDISRPVHNRQWFEVPRGDGLPEAWCYTDKLSYGEGDEIRAMGIASSRDAELALFTYGLNTTTLHSQSLKMSSSETPDDASINGCNWPEVTRIKVEPDWPSCVCRLVINTSDGGYCEHLVVIRAGKDAEKRAVLLLADGTWNAYNDWGGSNHYEGTVDSESNRFAAQLSVCRPFAKGLVSLPLDAPRTLSAEPQPEPSILYPHMQWAWDNGYSKKYASAGWAMYERPFVLWAEAQGIELDFLSQRDLHQDPTLLDGRPCVICVGHDEYWSWAMREAIDAYVDGGGNIARFAGNFMWQIRISDDGGQQICHKYRSRSDDPYFKSERRHLTTTIWEAPEVGYPGRATFGLDASSGMYAGFGGLAPNGSGGFTIYREDHWAFNGAKLGYGDLLGAQSKIFGYEVDGLRYRIVDGLPFAETVGQLPEDLTILGMGLARMREDDFEEEEPPFVGDEDAVFIAEVLYESTEEAFLSKVNRGSGMMVHFTKGEGEVFHAGTTEWVAGLVKEDEKVEQVTKNVLRRFGVLNSN